MCLNPSPYHQLVIIDANIIIKAFEIGVWEALISRYRITILSTVVSEVKFYEDSEGHRQNIDLTPWVTSEQIKIEDIPLQDVKDFIAQTDKSYYDRIHPGELESLAFLFKNKDTYLITSADHIVYKTLGRFNMGEKGLSLEAMLKQIGLTKNLSLQYTEKFRVDCTNQGGIDFVYGFKS